jgi:hypothetical protein
MPVRADNHGAEEHHGGGDGRSSAAQATAPDVVDVRRMGELGARGGARGGGGGFLGRNGGDEGPSAPPPMDSWLPAPRAAPQRGKGGDDVGYIGVAC